jgi:hypothetical protein
MKKSWRYEVRTKGDGDYEYFIQAPEEDGVQTYNPHHKSSAIAYARAIGGWVVKLTITETKIFP